MVNFQLQSGRKSLPLEYRRPLFIVDPKDRLIGDPKVIIGDPHAFMAVVPGSYVRMPRLITRQGERERP